ncbi:hypothetical protein ColLi_10809 [Colletotrichum liriopes]|uniref:Uncharacterized protein n=1 Tax=Colletotrichum liriopes TaxID=708192 RepID=A0AA37LXS2_9PEZI|nr:hypothetical protein ColLi_10809 [Colletotrichum liriopes]
MTIVPPRLQKGVANDNTIPTSSSEQHQKVAQTSTEPCEAQEEVHAKAEETGNKNGQAREARDMHGSEDTGPQGRCAPRPGGFVPPYMLQAMANSEANSDEERAAAQRTLDFDMSRRTAGQHPEKDGQDESRTKDDGGGSGGDPTEASSSVGGRGK